MRQAPAVASIALVSTLGACSVIDRAPPADAVFSEGCGQSSPGAGPFSREIVLGETTRTYTVRFPGSYSRDFPYPLVFALHGAGGQGLEIREYSEIERVSRAQAIYVYPDAAEQGGGLTAWNPTPESPDLEFLEAVRAELSAEQCVDENRVFALGFSSGAAMANAWACFTPSLRAFAAVAGGPPLAACTKPVAAWIAHDRNDPIVDIEQGERARDAWRTINGCDAEPGPADPGEVGPCLTYPCDTEAVRWCESESSVNLGHTWPSWASESLWAFFEAQ